MSSRTFMDKLYLGRLDAGLFHAFRASRDERKVLAVVESYARLLEEFPPRSIEAEGRIPADMLRKMGELGLFGISVPTEYGGLGFNQWEYLMTIEELVKQDISLALCSIAHLSIGIKAILLFGTEEQRRSTWSPPLREK